MAKEEYPEITINIGEKQEITGYNWWLRQLEKFFWLLEVIILISLFVFSIFSIITAYLMWPTHTDARFNEFTGKILWGSASLIILAALILTKAIYKVQDVGDDDAIDYKIGFPRIFMQPIPRAITESVTNLQLWPIYIISDYNMEGRQTTLRFDEITCKDGSNVFIEVFLTWQPLEDPMSIMRGIRRLKDKTISSALLGLLSLYIPYVIKSQTSEFWLENPQQVIYGFIEIMALLEDNRIGPCDLAISAAARVATANAAKADKEAAQLRLKAQAEPNNPALKLKLEEAIKAVEAAKKEAEEAEKAAEEPNRKIEERKNALRDKINKTSEALNGGGGDLRNYYAAARYLQATVLAKRTEADLLAARQQFEQEHANKALNTRTEGYLANADKVAQFIRDPLKAMEFVMASDRTAKNVQLNIIEGGDVKDLANINLARMGAPNTSATATTPTTITMAPTTTPSMGPSNTGNNTVVIED